MPQETDPVLLAILDAGTAAATQFAGDFRALDDGYLAHDVAPVTAQIRKRALDEYGRNSDSGSDNPGPNASDGNATGAT